MMSTRSAVTALAAFAALCVLTSVALPAQRVVLFEEVKNWGCVPCATSDPIIQGVLDGFGDQVASIRWHTDTPSTDDPFYNFNPGPVDTRTDFYGINTPPDIVIDGANTGDPFDAASMTNAIAARLGAPSPLIISAVGEVTGGSCTIFVDVEVETPVAPDDHRLFVMLVENYVVANGPNGAPDHYDVFRWANNGNTGTGESIDLGTIGTQSFQYSFPFDPSFQEDQMSVRVWVQNYTTRVPVQAATADLTVPYDLDLSAVGPVSRIGTETETVVFNCLLSNTGTDDDAYDLSISGVPPGWTYSYTTPLGTFSGPSSIDILTQESAAISVSVDSQGLSGMADIRVNVRSQAELTKFATLDFTKINDAEVLLVDDDGGTERSDTVAEALTANGVVFGTWDKQFGDLTTAELETAADAIVWVEGLQLPTLTEEDRNALSGLLDNGGKLFIAGQEIAFDLADPLSPNFEPATIVFFVTYLHAVYTNTGPNPLIVDGVPGDPITDGLLDVALEGSGPNGQTIADAFGPGTGAEKIFSYEGSFDAGLRWTDGSAQLVFLGFGIEGIADATERNTFVQRVLDWFDGETAGIGEAQDSAPSLFSLAQNTPNPFHPSTSIEYRLTNPDAVTLRIYDVGGRMVRELVDERQPSGTYTARWDGRDGSGDMVASGVYFYRLETANGIETRRMVLTR